jgi:hypothetical protein
VKPNIGDLVRFVYERGVEYDATVVRVFADTDRIDVKLIDTTPDLNDLQRYVPQDASGQWCRSWHKVSR